MPIKHVKKKIEKVNVDALLAKAKEPGVDALKFHPFYRGKVEITPKAPVRTFDDFAIWYSPGVAQPCLAIKADKDKVWDMTNRWNQIAVISDGTRILGLGNIGAEAGLPVMEGKSMLFKYLGGVDAFPICIGGSKKKEDIIQFCKLIQPCIGGINLEDIESPKCYEVLDTLRKELEIPVWHDDQQGTALVTVAGFINAVKVVGKKMNEVSVAIVGAGAAMSNVVKYLGVAGCDLKKFYVADTKGILSPSRLESVKDNPMKVFLAKSTNKEGRIGGLAEAMKGTDAVLAASAPGIIKKEWVSTMAKDAIVFGCANPVPEIWPWEAEEAGAAIVATGRSDFKNQVNNSLGFPSVFRGALDVSAKTITDEMCIAGAFAIAKYAEEKTISEEYIIPSMSETQMFIDEAVAVGMKAIEQGIARKKISKKELEEKAAATINRAQETTKLLMKNKIILPPPK